MMVQNNNIGLLRVAVACPASVTTDVYSNTKKMIQVANDLVEQKVSLVVFPELFLTGYSCGDLFFQTHLLSKVNDAIYKVINELDNNLICIFGAPLLVQGRLLNVAVVANQGKIVGIIPKTFLCNSGEYQEERWFSSANNISLDMCKIGESYAPIGTDLIFSIAGTECKFGIEICEDIWSVVPPSTYLASAGANCIVNLSASNALVGKNKFRSDLVKFQSAKTKTAYLYNSAGSNESTSEMLFSGHIAVAEVGKMLVEDNTLTFKDKVVITDIDYDLVNVERMKTSSFAETTHNFKPREIEVLVNPCEISEPMRKVASNPFIPNSMKARDLHCMEVFTIQSMGLAKRITSIKASKVILGLSGGLDSSLALLCAIKALQIIGLEKNSILAVSMPSFGTSNRTKNNARILADKLGVDFFEIDITNSVKSHFADIKHDINQVDIVFENAQARERTQILFDLANKYNGIVVGTGDLSELALGWCTYGADQISMYNVNAGIPKTLVREILKYLAVREFEIVKDTLIDVVDTPISPELLPVDKNGNIAQLTENVIGDYDIHDFMIYWHLRYSYSPKKLLFFAKKAFGDRYFDEELIRVMRIFFSRFYSQQFKRSMMPEGIKVGTVGLSPRSDYRLPGDLNMRLFDEELANLDKEL